MDFFHSQNQKHPPNHNKRRLNPDQVRLLERSFTSNNKLENEHKLQLANQLRVSPRQVAIWYQNKRARWRTQNLELDYNVLQQKLEDAVAEKRRLEKDVERLKGELEKAQEMVLSLKQTGPDQVSCHSIPVDEPAGSSSFHEAGVINCSVEKGEVLPIDEDLYACWNIDGDGASWD